MTEVIENVSEYIIEDCWLRIKFFRDDFSNGWPLFQPTTTQVPWGFPVHCSCWRLLKTKYPEAESRDVIKALFDICRSHPAKNGVLKWGHTYNGLYAYRPTHDIRPPGSDRNLWTETRLIEDVCFCDPYDSSLLHLDTPRDSLFRSTTTVVSHSSTASVCSDPFRRLPEELILLILIALPSNSVCAARLASRSFASCVLYESFWRSRFKPGGELHHVSWLVEQSSHPGNWSTLYREARRLDHSPSMLNTKRVWSLVCHLEDLIRFRLWAVAIQDTPLLPNSVYYKPEPQGTSDLELGELVQHAEGTLCAFNH